MDWFVDIYAALMAATPAEKLALVAALPAPDSTVLGMRSEVLPVAIPGRPAKPELIHPSQVARRKLHSPQGRAALVHAVAHIEFNAINLALDACYRFRGMPLEYYVDWLRVAKDEAKHFRLLTERLALLDYAYGDFAAHDGLWEMAVKTAHNALHRMALVPRVLEARGLDVTPGMIRRLEQAGDPETVAILHIILEEEVPHVEIGTRWYRFLCMQQELPPDQTFHDLLGQYNVTVKLPINEVARLAAGFSAAELAEISQKRSKGF